MRKKSVFRIQFSGEAGEGIITAGETLMHVAVQLGYQSTVFKSYPSNIRGGYSIALVTISESPIISPLSRFDILIASNLFSFQRNRKLLSAGDVLIVESSVAEKDSVKPHLVELEEKKVVIFEVPIVRLAKEIGGPPGVRSTLTVGILSFLLDSPFQQFESVIRNRFVSKGEKVVALNIAALESGYAWAKEKIKNPTDYVLNNKNRNTRSILNVDGNTAVAMGALVAGCTFFASYPITPATSIGDSLAQTLPVNGGFAYQAEDEIAALGAVIGAVFSGEKAMTATSGPGLSLMQELLGYASITELPLVVIDVQRAGPSTGLPTKHGQDDLFAAAYGGHGEGPRVIVAPTGVADCFSTTIEAFNLAERFQCPVIMLSDSSMAMIKETIPQPDVDAIEIKPRDIVVNAPADKPFARYRISENGCNPFPVPGVSNITYRVTGVEHDEYSAPGYAPEMRMKQMDKRFNKLNSIEMEYKHLVEWDTGELDENDTTDIAVIAWGLIASVTKQAIGELRLKGYRIAAFYPRLLLPFCSHAFDKLCRYSSRIVVPETNYTGQYSRIIRMHTNICPISITISRGEPFFTEEIVCEIEKYIHTLNQQE